MRKRTRRKRRRKGKTTIDHTLVDAAADVAAGAQHIAESEPT